MAKEKPQVKQSVWAKLFALEDELNAAGEQSSNDAEKTAANRIGREIEILRRER